MGSTSKIMAVGQPNNGTPFDLSKRHGSFGAMRILRCGLSAPIGNRNVK
jgi:hypothetical protein